MLEMKKAMVHQKIGPEAFYEIATIIVRDSTEVRFATKTPALILPCERIGKWRSLYYETLLTKIKEGKIQAKYLFSLPTTSEQILRLAKEDKHKALNVLNEWIQLLEYRNLDLRYVEHQDFISCVIGDRYTLIGWKDPDLKTRAATVLSDEMEFYRDVFDMIFKEASNNHKRVIQDLRVNVERLR